MMIKRMTPAATPDLSGNHQTACKAIVDHTEEWEGRQLWLTEESTGSYNGGGGWSTENEDIHWTTADFLFVFTLNRRLIVSGRRRTNQHSN